MIKVQIKEAEMYILAIVSSPRPNGNTSYLTDQALKGASKLGARIEKISLNIKVLLSIDFYADLSILMAQHVD